MGRRCFRQAPGRYFQGPELPAGSSTDLGKLAETRPPRAWLGRLVFAPWGIVRCFCSCVAALTSFRVWYWMDFFFFFSFLIFLANVSMLGCLRMKSGLQTLKYPL